MIYMIYIIKFITGFVLSYFCVMYSQFFINNINSSVSFEENASSKKRPFILDMIFAPFSMIKEMRNKGVSLPKITKKYLLLVLLLAIIYTVLPLGTGLSIYLGTIIFICFVVISIVDFNTFFVPEGFIGILFLVSIFLSLSTFSTNGSHLFVYMIIFGLVFWLMSVITKGGFAIGDVEIIIVMAGFLGEFVIFSLILSAILNVFVWAMLTLLFRKEINLIAEKNKGRNDLLQEDVIIEEKIYGLTVIDGKVAMAFGPFLSVSALLFYFYGNNILDLFYSSILPYIIF